ncbi:hypothetical protein P7C71_g2700, partial [Lecanoromycetidae sp. Uapishka_2]
MEPKPLHFRKRNRDEDADEANNDPPNKKHIASAKQTNDHVEYGPKHIGRGEVGRTKPEPYTLSPKQIPTKGTGGKKKPTSRGEARRSNVNDHGVPNEQKNGCQRKADKSKNAAHRVNTDRVARNPSRQATQEARRESRKARRALFEREMVEVEKRKIEAENVDKGNSSDEDVIVAGRLAKKRRLTYDAEAEKDTKAKPSAITNTTDKRKKWQPASSKNINTRARKPNVSKPIDATQPSIIKDESRKPMNAGKKISASTKSSLQKMNIEALSMVGVDAATL